MKKETLFVSFSGGRTSAYMCWWLIENMSHKYNFIFVFANTGVEHEETLRFVDRCDKWMNLNLVWLESVVHEEFGKASSHIVVDFETACRTGRIFEDMIKVYGIPNKSYPHCNRELKLHPIYTYKESLGFSRYHKTAVGIRADEIDRMSEVAMNRGVIYPLISMNATTKEEVRHWWKEQPFDLEIPEHYGNCVTCWKKSDRKLMTIARHEPQRFEFFRSMEELYPTAGGGEGDRVFFRGPKSTGDIFAKAKMGFVEFKDCMPPLQFKMNFDIDELDIEDSCGASTCEVA
jgi:hypothetical protein